MNVVQAVSESVLPHGGKVAQGGAVTAVLGGLTLSEVGIMVGIAASVVGLWMQWYYNRKRDRREQMEHEERMKDLRQ